MLTYQNQDSITLLLFFNFGLRKEVGTATRKDTPASSARFLSKGRNEADSRVDSARGYPKGALDNRAKMSKQTKGVGHRPKGSHF